MLYDNHKKTQDSSTSSKPTASAHETTHSNVTSMRQPAWTQAMGDYPPDTLQTKLIVNQPGDAYEQEAERVADQVMSMPATGISPVQEDVSLRRKETNDIRSAQSAPFIVNQAIHSSGQPLDTETRSLMQSRFGHDFSQVKVHSDELAMESAQAIHARAYTVGQNIVFGKGQFEPRTRAGQKLLAHELTHVIQQGNNSVETGRENSQLAQIVQRDIIPVEIIERPTSDLSISDLIDSNIAIQVAMLGAYKDALTSFYEVINSASAKEAIPKSVGQIALDKTTKFVFQYMIDEAFKHMPGGEFIKKPFDLGKEILEAVEKEEARAEKAAVSNTAMVFVVSERDKAADMQLELSSNSIDIRNQVNKNYQKMSKPDQNKLREALVSDNAFLKSQRDQAKQATLFKMLVESWIGGMAPTKEGGTPAYVFIRLDKDWKVITAYIHAPGGQRLAEELLRKGGGKVNLNEFKVPRTVEFFPEPYTWVTERFDANGNQVGNIENFAGPYYLGVFAEKISKLGLPETTVLTGDVAETE